MTKLLIVEDDKNIQKLLKAYLETDYDLVQVEDGEAALSFLKDKQQVDIMITDVMMPNMDGFALVKALRKEGFKFPVMMLTAKDTIQDKTVAFSNGADDYMVKPIDYQELKLRLIALLRRAGNEHPNQLIIQDIVIDRNNYTVHRGEEVVEFSKKEFELLYKLLSTPNQIFTKEQLLDAVWGEESFSTEDTVKTHISKLRKLCRNFEDVFKIITVRGLGYKGEVSEEK